jgi:SpoVK/Ycf46/Vps4 family AAA+-type ATPase
VKSELLKRLFRALSERPDPELRKLCGIVIQDVRKKKQLRLADQLQSILDSSRDTSDKVIPFKVTSNEAINKSLPSSRKSAENLVSILSRHELEHYMVLPPRVEERFQRIEKEYAARERLHNYGLKPKKRILLYGPPGCGKTLGAKRLAWNTGLKLVKVQFDVMMSSLFGESASNLRSVFEYCAQNPSLLLLDECDFIARKRVNSRDIGEAQRIVNTLLQLLEDFSFPGLVVATTNLYEHLDHALLRRFDDAFEVPFPDEPERFRLLELSFSTVQLSKDVDLSKLMDSLKGLSAADIVKIAQNAAKFAVLHGERTVTRQVLDSAIREHSTIA